MKNLSKHDLKNIDKLLSLEEFDELVENVKLYMFSGECFYGFEKCSKYSILTDENETIAVYVDIKCI